MENSMFRRWVKRPLLMFRMMSDSANSRVPQHMTTAADRFWLRATRTMPTEKIGPEVSQTIMEKAFTRRRVGINIVMLFATLATAIVIIQKGKKIRRARLKEADKRFGR